MLSKVKKKLKETLSPIGFNSKGNCYYYIKNDIAFCLSFDKPSGILYSTFHVVPLYMPCEGLHYTYGERLNYLPDSSVDILTEPANDSDIDEWFEGLLNTLNKIIFPFFQKISSPSELLRFVNGRPAAVNKFFHCPPDQLDRLRVFTYLYLNDYKNLKLAIKRSYDSITRANCTDELKNTRKNELVKIESCLSDSTSCGREYCAEMVNKSTQACFGK